MVNFNLTKAKESIKEIAGEDYSPCKLEKAVGPNKDDPDMLLTCMLGLGVKMPGEDKRLTKLRKYFYRKFEQEVNSLFDLLHAAAGFHKLTVNDPDLFIESTVKLLAGNVISTSSIRNLAGVIKATCHISYVEGTIRNKLYNCKLINLI